MRHVGRCIILLHVFCILLQPRLDAQSRGTLSGRVLDQTQALIPGVTVELVSGAGQSRTALTMENGLYTFEGVPAGTAEITFKLINFTTVRRRVVVETG